MTSISSATSQAFSPLARLQSELASEVSAGTIGSDDQSALSTALTDIDSAVKSGASSGDGSPPSPDAMKAKIESLISNEVTDGKLTSAQAEELKNVFAQAFAGGAGGSGGGPSGAGGAGGPGGAGGGGGTSKSSSSDPADTNGDGTVSAAEQAAYDANSATSSTGSDSDKLVQDFLKLLQNSKDSSSTYGASGDSLASKLKSLLVDYQV